jgi:hypothetical protein
MWRSILARAASPKEAVMEHPVARRTLIKGAGVGLGAGLASSLAQATETTGAAAAQSGAEVWSGEYWAKKGDVSLNLWRKRIGAPRPGEPPPRTGTCSGTWCMPSLQCRRASPPERDRS